MVYDRGDKFEGGRDEVRDLNGKANHYWRNYKCVVEKHKVIKSEMDYILVIGG